MLQEYFKPFRQNIIGIDQTFRSPLGGENRIIYADWTASGRLYRPIEQAISERFGPFVGNTHSESSLTGALMTEAYRYSHEIIKRHVNADHNDVLLNVGYGMTSAILKLQRIMGLRVPEQLRHHVNLKEEERPVVFVTHMEHHSNQTTWHESLAEVCVVRHTPEGLVDENDLCDLLAKYRNRKLKIGSFTACSNVTGIQSPYHRLAKCMHEAGGYCFVDFAASAPYVNIDMHPPDPMEQLDAITFSPHKFLGGPGTSGILIFAKNLYTLRSPDQPGGGTVMWTNPWGEYRFFPDIELREDGGTPGFLLSAKAALAVQLKEQIGIENIRLREGAMVRRLFPALYAIPGLHLLAGHLEERLPIFSFYFSHLHYNLVVRILNDRFGIQARGGCSCAGTYGHYLLHVGKYQSKRITDEIDKGDLSLKPGWVRVSLHPTMTDDELDLIADALGNIAQYGAEWAEDYTYDAHANEYRHRNDDAQLHTQAKEWFSLG